MTTIPQAPLSVNLELRPEEHHPSYYGVLPAPVRYCKSLPPAAKLLFTEITALCSVKGYCWASNAHFASLYDVEPRTVRRWLSDLSQAGFVRIELGPVPGDRRVYDLTATPGQKRPGGRTKKTPPPDKQDPPSIKGITKGSNIKELLPRGLQFVGPGPVAARDLARNEQEEKGSASPPSPSTLRAVERAVSLTRDLRSRERFKALWEEVHTAGCPEVWKMAVDALKEASKATSTPSVMTELFISHVEQFRDEWGGCGGA